MNPLEASMAVSKLDYRCYNPLFPLYAKEVNKGLGICRVADDAKIATVVVRDLKVLAQFQWDNISGKCMAVFYKDGSVRIYDAFRAGKLLALLRLSREPVDGALWDRIEICRGKEDGIYKFDQDIINAMPGMIRFARDTRQIYILPYEPPNTPWRLATVEEDGVPKERRILDVFVVHQEDHGLVLMLNGDLIVKLERGLPTSQLREVVAAGPGLYHCFYEDTMVETLNLDQLIGCDPTIQLIEHSIAIKQLSRYLQDHLDLIKNDLVSPYTEFLAKVCDNAFGYRALHEELESLLLAGDVSVELENWLCYTVGDKNLKKWKKLGLDMYQKSIQILTLSFIPACERLILLSNRCRANLEALQLLESCSIVETTNFTNLTSLGQDCLRLALETIQGASAQEVFFSAFLEWLTDWVHEALDEDYKPKLSLDSNCRTAHQISTYLSLRIDPENQADYDNTVFRLDSFQTLLHNVSETLQIIGNQEIEPKLLRKISRKVFHNLAEKNHQKLLAVAPLPAQRHIVCFLSDQTGHTPIIYTRVLEKSTLAQASATVPIEMPFGLRELSQPKIRLLGIAASSESIQHHSHSHHCTPNAQIVFAVSTDAAACQEEFTVRCQVTPTGVVIPVESNSKSEC